MIIRSAKAMGAAIRDRRRALGLDQGTVARMVGVSRQWLSAIERGKDTAALGLVLRTLTTLDMNLDLLSGDMKASPSRGARPRQTPAADIDGIVTRSRRTGKTSG